MLFEIASYLQVVFALVSVKVYEDNSRAVVATLRILHHRNRLDFYLLPIVILCLLMILFLEIGHYRSKERMKEKGQLIYLWLNRDQSRSRFGLLYPFHDLHNIIRKSNQILCADALGLNIVLNIHALRRIQSPLSNLLDIPQRPPYLPLQIIRIHIQHLIRNDLRILLYVLELQIGQISTHRQQAFHRSLRTCLALLVRHIIDLPVKHLEHQFEVGLILMLCPQSSQKFIIHLIVIGQLLILIPGEINQYPRID